MKKFASNHHQMVYDKLVRKSTPEILEMNALNTLSTQVIEQKDVDAGSSDSG